MTIGYHNGAILAKSCRIKDEEGLGGTRVETKKNVDGYSATSLVGIGELAKTLAFINDIRRQLMITYPKNRSGVVFVVLERYTAIPGTIGIQNRVRLHAVVGISSLSPKAVRTRGKPCGALAGSVVRHILTGNRAHRASTLSVKEDHKDQRTDKGKTPQDTNDDSSD